MEQDTSLKDLVGGDVSEVFDYTPALGGDTGRGELPNLPGKVQSSEDYKALMQPAKQTYSSEDIGNYASKMLGLPSSAPPVHQLSLMAGQYTPENDDLNNDRGRQYGASLIRRQMNESQDQGWKTDPMFSDYINSIGLDAGRNDQWSDQIQKLYGI